MSYSGMIEKLSTIFIVKVTPRRVTFSHLLSGEHGCPQMRSADHPGKMDEKLKSENMQQKKRFSMFMLYFDSNQGRQV